MNQNDRWNPSTPNSLSSNQNDAPGQVLTKAQVAMRHPVGQRLQLKVGRVLVYGFFAEIEPGTGFDALCHVSHIHGLDGRSPLEVFSTGQLVECTVYSVNVTVDEVRVQLACEAPPPPVSVSAEQMTGMPEAFKPLIASLHEIEQWVLGHPTQAQELFSGLQAAVKDLPATRLVFRNLFKPQSTVPVGNIGQWIEQNPQISESAHDWLRERVRDRPLHASLLGEIAKRFGVPKPVTRWVSCFSEFVALSAADSPNHQPAIAFREKLNDTGYWTGFAAKLPPEEAAPATEAGAKQEAEESPASQDRGNRIWVDGSNFVRSIIGAEGLEALLGALKNSGRSPLVVFDAATPWRVDEAGKVLIKRLVDAGEATIVPGGSQADDYLLLMAEKSDGDIVSNDLFRDKLDRHPWLAGDGKKRVHTALVADGMVVIPDLGICSPVV